MGESQLQQRLRALFAEELTDGLQVLVPGVLDMEQRAGATSGADLVRELFRAAHSLKGAAHAAGVPEAVAACERLESAFAAVRDGEQAPDTALVGRLLAETDVLAAVIPALQQAPPGTAAAVPVPRRQAGRHSPTPSGPVPTPRPAPPAAPPRPTASLRVSTTKVDAVVRRAGDSLAAARRLHEVAAQAAQAAEQVETARGRLRAALADGDGAVPRGASTLLDDAARSVAALARTVEVADRHLHQTSTGAAEAVQRLRTQPFAEACDALDRAVRDIATRAGKSARLTVEGADIDVDRSVIAALRDPLLHLVRNAVDHGLEPDDVRIAAGKPATGTVAVVAELAGSLLQVTVRDDGAGIDVGALREAAVRRGIPMPSEDLELAFVPGLSSRTDVTSVSGRGVGLDAARGRLEQLGGTLQVLSRPGTGTEVRLTTPLSLAVLRVLLVRAGGQVVALPTSSVDRVLEVDRNVLRKVGGQVLLTIDGTSSRTASLAEALGFAVGPPTAGRSDRIGVVVPRDGGTVLVTEGLLDELEVSVQPVPTRLAGALGVVGVTTGSAGVPAVVVNPVAVGRHAGTPGPATDRPEQAPAARILLAEDTVTTRALERSILETAGYSVAVAVDGADAWRQLQADGADLVVSDVDMPHMSGIDLCRRIRSSPRLRELPVVLVTSLDGTADRQRGLEAGADAYVTKAEFSQGALLDTIARLL